MSNMKTEYNFQNDIVIANYAYKQCENFIRSVEQKNDNNIKNGLVANEEYEDLYSECVDGFDYYIVGKVLSMAEHRSASFEQYVEELATDKADRSERAYKWLMMNAVYVNYTIARTKSKRARKIFLPKQMQRQLQAYVRSVAKRPQHGYLFSTQKSAI